MNNLSIAIISLIISNGAFSSAANLYAPSSAVPAHVQAYTEALISLSCDKQGGIAPEVTVDKVLIQKLSNEETVYRLGLSFESNDSDDDLVRKGGIIVSSKPIANSATSGLTLQAWKVPKKYCNDAPKKLQMECGDHWYGVRFELDLASNTTTAYFDGDSGPEISELVAVASYSSFGEPVPKILLNFVGPKNRYIALKKDAPYGWAARYKIDFSNEYEFSCYAH